MAPQPGDAIFLLRASMNRDSLADRIIVANLDPGHTPPVRQVLRLAADGDKRRDRVKFTDLDRSEHANVSNQPGPSSDLDIGTDDAPRPNEGVLGDARTGIDAR